MTEITIVIGLRTVLVPDVSVDPVIHQELVNGTGGGTNRAVG